jgi:hypothetical protein
MVMANLVVLRKTVCRDWQSAHNFRSLGGHRFFPLFGAIIQGQDCILLLFLRTRGRHIQKGKTLVTGAILGLGLFRFQLVLPLVSHPGGAAMAIAARICAGRRVAGPCIAGNAWMAGCRRLRASRFDSEKTGAGRSIVAVGMPNLRGMIADLPEWKPGRHWRWRSFSRVRSRRS